MIHPFFSFFGSRHQRIFETSPTSVDALSDLLPQSSPEGLTLVQSLGAAGETDKVLDTSVDAASELREDLDTQEREFSWHNAYMNYRDSLLPEKRQKWNSGAKGSESRPEFHAGNPDQQSVWIKSGRLVPGLLEEVLAEIIPPTGSIKINHGGLIIPVSGKEILHVLKQVAPVPVPEPAILNTTGVTPPAALTPAIALDWVNGLEQYVYKHEKPGGIQSKYRSAYEQANINLNNLSDGLGDFGRGMLEKFTDGDWTDRAQVAGFVFAVFKLFKKAPGQVKTLFWGGLGVYLFDTIQAEHTDLFGGKRILDMMANTDMSDIRETPLAAFLHSEQKTDVMHKKAGLLMLEVGMDELLQWGDDVISGPEPDLFANDERPKALYYNTMPLGLKNRFEKLFPEYRTANDFTASEVMWEVYQAFLIRSAKKAHRSDPEVEITVRNGMEYLRAKYTGQEINPKYQQYRNMIGRLHDLQYSKKAPTFSRVLEHEITAYDIEKTIAANQKVIEKIETFGLQKYREYAPLLEQGWNWTEEEMKKAFLFLEMHVLPIAKQTILQLAKDGWRLGHNFYTAAKNEIILFYGRHKDFIKLIRDGGVWMVKAPFLGLEWTVGVAEKSIPVIASTVKSLAEHAGEFAKENLHIGRKDIEKEQVTPANEFELYGVLEELELIETIKHAYRIEAMDMKGLAGAPDPNKAYNVPILEICKEIMADKAAFGRELTSFISELEINQYAAGKVEWTAAGGASADGSSVPIEFHNFKNIPRWMIGRAFVLDIIAVEAIDKHFLEPGKDLVDIVLTVIKGMADIATLNWNQVESIIWRVVEKVHPHTSPNISAAKKTKLIRDIIEKRWKEPAGDKVIWEYENYIELVDATAKKFNPNKKVNRQIFEATCRELVGDILYRAHYSQPGTFFLDGPPGATTGVFPRKAEVQEALNAIFKQIAMNGYNLQFGGMPGISTFVKEHITFAIPARAATNKEEMWRLRQP